MGDQSTVMSLPSAGQHRRRQTSTFSEQTLNLKIMCRKSKLCAEDCMDTYNQTFGHGLWFTFNIIRIMIGSLGLRGFIFTI